MPSPPSPRVRPTSGTTRSQFRKRRAFALAVVIGILLIAGATVVRVMRDRESDGPASAVAAGSTPIAVASVAATQPPSVSAGPSPTQGGTAASTSTSTSTSPSTQPAARFTGPADGAVLAGSAAKALVFSVAGVSPERVQATIDGRPVAFTAVDGESQHRPSGLGDGRHTFEMTVDGASGDTQVTRSFTVDTTGPTLSVRPLGAASTGKPLTMTGAAANGSTLTANGRPVPVTGGRWTATFPTAPAAVDLVATDEAGNTTSKRVAVSFAVPVTRAVHMTARAWGYKPKREAVMALLRSRKINAIEVDIKDESGLVGYATKVPLATTVGAVEPHYDAAKMLAEVHGAGGRVIGRLVAFRDPVLTKWAWTTGRRELVLQTAAGTPYTGSYGDYAFPNFSHPTVQQYNVDIAVEAAKVGFDDVLYDYVRRPDGKLSQMRIPGLKGTPEQSVAGVLAATKAGFQKAGLTTYLGASVFGIAATRPREIAQDIVMMAPSVDYVAPMVYPSHWAKGEYKVADPNSQPYDIVQRSLKDFQTTVRGSNATVIPWLQDFSLGVQYGPDQVRAQIKASADDGIHSFLLWNAGANYTGSALVPMP